MLKIDGSQGEGGGQVLRTALAMSIVTRTPFRIDRIRAGREKPGLLHQHLTAVRAAAAVGQARVKGADLGSRQLTFEPGEVLPGPHSFAVGTAGSAVLVLQTVLPPLLTASGPSTLTIEGGTHNMAAPPFDFIERAFLPLVARMGPGLTARLDRHGFYPAGGGQFTVTVEPAAGLVPLHLLARGPIRRTTAQAVIARLPRHVAERELALIGRELSLPESTLHIVEANQPRGPGNIVLIEVEADEVTEIFAGFGQRGVPAEVVAGEAVREAREYLAADVPVGPHLADQLIVPLALARGGAFCTLPLTLHATTNIDVVRQFLDVQFVVEEQPDGATLMRVA